MGATLEQGDRIQPNPRVTYRKLADGSGGVLLHLDTAAYHGLNETGVTIWGLIGDGVTFGQLIEGLRGTLDEVPDDLEDDVAGFISGLAERGLVVIGSLPDD